MGNDDDDTATLNKPLPPSKFPIPESQQELYCLQSQLIENSFQEKKSRASSKQPQYIFEDLSLLQRNIQDNFGTRKRDLSSHYPDSHTLAITNENLPPPHPPSKYAIQKKLSIDVHRDPVANDTICSLASSPSRPPLNPIDINSHTDDTRPI
jgi:hypothetical protein